MELFKNGVGRPSNETLSKRRKVIFLIVVAVIAVLGTGAFFVVNYFGNNQVSSESKNAAVNPKSKTFTATFYPNGSVGNVVTRSCSTTGTSCKIIAPAITPKADFKALGWYTTRTKTDGETVKPSKTLNLTSNKTFYAITKANSSYIARFYKGSTVSTISETGIGCYRINGESSCAIKAPTITPKKGYTALGWATTSSATSASVKVGEVINLTSSRSYYTVTKLISNTYTATFYSNGSRNSLTTKSCTASGTATSCKITTPAISAASGFSVVGWGTSSGATTASIGANKSLTLTGNKSFYAITKSTSKYTASYVKGTGVKSINFSSMSCFRYNGATSCAVATPSITPNNGYVASGWATTKNSSTVFVGMSRSLTLTSNKTLYTVVKKK